MTETLAIWDRACRTDPAFTKRFSRGGGFSGTATNATYLARRATEMFGPCGLGWGVKVLDERVLDGADGARVHRVHIDLWYRWQDDVGHIEHFGQTMLVGKNKNGSFTDEEAPKKSLTDAMTKALSLLGFAADVHLGLYDDNKYVAELKAEFSDARPNGAEPPAGPAAAPAKAKRPLAPITVNGEQVEPEKSAYQARKDGDWPAFMDDLKKYSGDTNTLIRWVPSRLASLQRHPWYNDSLKEWRGALVTALAKECQSCRELDAWGGENQAAIDKLPLDWRLAASGALEDAKNNFGASQVLG